MYLNYLPPSREATSAIGVVRGAVDAGDLADGHGHDALVPALDDLPEADLEGEGLLAGVLGAPELQVHVAVLSEPGAVDGDGPASGGLDAVTLTNDSLFETHCC